MVQLPTDSLYKFMFIAGIVMVVYASHLYDRTTEVRMISRSQLNLEDSVSKYHDLRPELWERFEQRNDQDSIRFQRQLEFASSQFMKYELARQADNRIFNYKMMKATIIGVLGLVFLILGSILWYRKLQVFQDEMQKLELMKLRQELTEKGIN